MKIIHSVILAGILILTGQPAFSQTEQDLSQTPKVKKEWKEIAGFGMIKIVYMSSTGLEDHEYIGKFLKQIVKKDEPLTVWIFDDEASAPHTLPVTDEQKSHWKAQYTFDPENKREAFAFIAPVDPGAEPLELRETKTDIGTGYFTNND